MDKRLEFSLRSHSSVTSSECPIYDIFFCRDRYIGMVAPYYARAAMGDVRVLVNDKRAPLQMLPDSRQFTMSVLAEIPGSLRDATNWNIQILQGRRRRVCYECNLSRLSFCNKWRGRIAMATLAKHDSPYIEEWVDYHVALGVEHFYIYNNNASQIREALSDCAPALVTQIDWPYPYTMSVASLEPFWPADSHHYTQLPQQMHAILKYGDHWDWLGMMDADEFVVPLTDEPLADTLDQGAFGAWCELPHVHCAGVELQGKWFGTSGHDDVRSPVMRNYTKCERGHTAATKWFVRPQHINAAAVHYFENTGQPARVPTNILRYNHYRAISNHKLRRKPTDHSHYSNETTEDSNK